MRAIREVVVITGISVIALGMTSCGFTVQPVTTESIPAPGSTIPGRSNPGRADPGQQPEIAAGTREVCRSGSRPRGWIAIGYEQDLRTCPKPVEPDNPYTKAIIMRFSDYPVGATLWVCADQNTPSGWQRLDDQPQGERCPGARVSKGMPTAYLMRRID